MPTKKVKRDTAPSHNDLDADRCVTTGSHTYGKTYGRADCVQGGACVICGEPFAGWHLRTKKTCSAACRKTLSRYSQRLDDNFHRMMEMIDFFGKASEIDEHRKKAISGLITLREAIDEILDEANDDAN